MRFGRHDQLGGQRGPQLRRLLLVIGSLAAVLGIALPVLASAAPPAKARIGRAPVAPRGSRVVGTLSPSTQLQVSVALQPRDPNGLADYAQQVATPGSSLYHHYLSVHEFARMFGPTSGQIQAVSAALRQAGLNPGTPSANGLSIPVRASAGQLSASFATSFDRVSLPSGRTAYANTSAPQLPASAASSVQAIIGLDDLTQLQPAITPASHSASTQAAPQVVTGGPQPQTCAQGHGGYTADQLASAYGLSGLYGAGDLGAGQHIGLYELYAYNQSDITAYESCYTQNGSTLNPQINTYSVDGGTTALSPEVALDMEDVISLAPSATVDVYEGPNGGSGIYDTYNAIVSKNVDKVVSVSYGTCEPAYSNANNVAAENALFEEAAAQGQSILAASGDTGSEGCADFSVPNNTTELAVEDPASQPYVTGVGGTDLASTTTNGTTTYSESVWNGDGCSNCGGGGGISTFWSMPSYQLGASSSVGVVNSTYSSGTPCGAASGSYCRQVPDVSADAAPGHGYPIYYSGAWGLYGGTSAATPTWAALIALADESSTCGGKDLGFLNPSLYSLAGSAYSSDFNDITSGNNDVYSMGGKFPAGAGYDMASGLGSPKGTSLASGLCGLIGSTTTPTATVLGTLSLPAGTTSKPTSVAVNPTTHTAYVDESAGNAVAQITGTGGAFSGMAAGADSSLTNLSFPDGLTLDSAGNVYATSFCAETTTGLCSGRANAGGKYAYSTSNGGAQYDYYGCPYPAGVAVASGVTLVACAGNGGFLFSDPSYAPYSPSDSIGSTTPSGVAAAASTFNSTATFVMADAGANTLTPIMIGGTSVNYNTPTPLASNCDPANVAVGPVSQPGPSIKTEPVYVACPGNGTIEVGTLTNTSGTLSLGGFEDVPLPTTGSNTPSPYGVAINSAGTLLAVTDSANNDVVIYPQVSGNTLGGDDVVATGSVPDGVAVDGGNVFVANEGSGTVTALDPPTAPVAAQAGQTVSGPVAAPPSTTQPLVPPVSAGTVTATPPVKAKTTATHRPLHRRHARHRARHHSRRRHHHVAQRRHRGAVPARAHRARRS